MRERGAPRVQALLPTPASTEAFSCEYVLTILADRKRLLPELGALHVTRGHDLLELDLPEPDLDAY